jgi:hypothetical protein
LENHLSCVYHFAGLSAASRNGACDGGFQLSIADPILRYFKLRLGVIDRRLRGVKPLLGLVEEDLGREAARQQGFLTLKGASVLDQPCFSGGQRRAGRANGCHASVARNGPNLSNLRFFDPRQAQTCR